MNNLPEARSCPFCGRHLNLEDADTMYPTGCWREHPDGFRSYHGFADKIDGDGTTYQLGCSTNYGGCGAHIYGDSIPEVVGLWNRRASDGMVQMPKNRQEAEAMLLIASYLLGDEA